MSQQPSSNTPGGPVDGAPGESAAGHLQTPQTGVASGHVDGGHARRLRRGWLLGGMAAAAMLLCAIAVVFLARGEGRDGARKVGGVYFHPPKDGPSVGGLSLEPPTSAGGSGRLFKTGGATFKNPAALFAWTPEGAELEAPWSGGLIVPDGVTDVTIVYAKLPREPDDEDRRHMTDAAKAVLRRAVATSKWPAAVARIGDLPEDRLVTLLLAVGPSEDAELLALVGQSAGLGTGSRGRAAALVYFLAGHKDDAGLRTPDDPPEPALEVFIRAADRSKRREEPVPEGVTRGAITLLRAQTRATPRMDELLKRLGDHPLVHAFHVDRAKEPGGFYALRSATFLATSEVPGARELALAAAAPHVADPSDPAREDWINVVRATEKPGSSAHGQQGPPAPVGAR